jgi:putative ABC transport system permease protein
MPAVATVVAVGAVCAAATFTSSLDHLTREPARYGAVWDVSVGNYADPAASEQAADWLASNPDVEAFAGLQSEEVSIDGRSVTVIVSARGSGVIEWALQEGHAPVGPDEIALGSNTLDDLDKHVGDTVSLSAGGDVTRDLTIVGRAVLAPPDVEGVEPGRGALIDISATEPFETESDQIFSSGFVIRLRDDVAVDDAVDRLHDRFFTTTTYPAVPPNAVLNVERVSRLPVLLAALVAALSGAVFVHTLSGEIRQRRKELAVLKTIGLRGTQISAVLAWQASTIATVGVALGVPAGLLVGRAGWRVVSDQLGVAWLTAVPLATFVALAASSVLLANLVAIGPGLRARRTRPAEALRTE